MNTDAKDAPMGKVATTAVWFAVGFTVGIISPSGNHGGSITQFALLDLGSKDQMENILGVVGAVTGMVVGSYTKGYWRASSRPGQGQ